MKPLISFALLFFAINALALANGAVSQADVTCQTTEAGPIPTQAQFAQPDFYSKYVSDSNREEIYKAYSSSLLESDPVIAGLTHYNTKDDHDFGNFYTIDLRDGREVVLPNLFPFAEQPQPIPSGQRWDKAMPPLAVPSENLRVTVTFIGAEGVLDVFLVQLEDLASGQVLSQFDRYAYDIGCEVS